MIDLFGFWSGIYIMYINKSKKHNLVFIIKAYEDIVRHRSDNEVNSKEVKVIRGGCFEIIKSKDIKVGICIALSFSTSLKLFIKF